MHGQSWKSPVESNPLSSPPGFSNFLNHYCFKKKLVFSYFRYMKSFLPRAPTDPSMQDSQIHQKIGSESFTWPNKKKVNANSVGIKLNN